jgi:hypothetical protein
MEKQYFMKLQDVYKTGALPGIYKLINRIGL